LIVLGIHTALRISDLLRLTWDDVYDASSESFRTHIITTEGKTGKSKAIALHTNAVTALEICLPHRRGVFIFANNRRHTAPISRVQAYRIIKTAAKAVQTAMPVSCHSLRKTLGYHAWQAGTAVAVIMDIYNHSSYHITRRYLGITQDDCDKVYLTMAFV